MVAKNDITGDPIKTRAGNSAYSEGWDRIFIPKINNVTEKTLFEMMDDAQKVDGGVGLDTQT